MTANSVNFESEYFNSAWLVFQKEFNEGLYCFELDMGNIEIDNNAKALANLDARRCSLV